MAETIYDVVIVGAGPAGLTSATYTARRALKTLVISKDIGGQAAWTDIIENYPGFESVGGLELMQNFHNQAKKSGAEFEMTEVTEIIKEDKLFTVKTINDKKFQAKAIILGFGLTPRNLEVPGEKELIGKGVAYCATCDGPLYKGRDIIVVGGGNSALDAAEYMSKIANKVYILHRGDKFRGEQTLIDEMNAAKNIEIIFNANTVEIVGENKVEKLVYKTNDEKTAELKVDGVFVEIGHIAKTAWLGDLVEYTDRKEIKISRDCETKTPGLFAAGDVTDITYKQAVISAGEGSKAALQAARFLQGDKVLTPDWKKQETKK